MASEPVKLLIVDDEPRNLDALEVMLASSGCTFIRASSPDDALLAMLQHDFAAMVLDIRMPGMSGIELARLIKQRKRTRDVPILFLTAHMPSMAPPSAEPKCSGLNRPWCHCWKKMAATRSPFWKRAVPGPVATTSPAPSDSGTVGTVAVPPK